MIVRLKKIIEQFRPSVLIGKEALNKSAGIKYSSTFAVCCVFAMVSAADSNAVPGGGTAANEAISPLSVVV